jgi:hypothetical protein
MSAAIKWSGLDELLQQLTDAPRDIRDEGLQIVRKHTEAGAEELRQHYPEESHSAARVSRGERTGVLRARVRTLFPSGTILIGLILSAAPHSHLWHWGTRQRKTSKGYNRGAMPAAKPEPLVPIANKHRERMFEELKQMLQRFGFQVG